MMLKYESERDRYYQPFMTKCNRNLNCCQILFCFEIYMAMTCIYQSSGSVVHFISALVGNEEYFQFRCILAQSEFQCEYNNEYILSYIFYLGPGCSRLPTTEDFRCALIPTCVPWSAALPVSRPVYHPGQGHTLCIHHLAYLPRGPHRCQVKKIH